MRVYVTDTQLKTVSELLRRKDVACHVSIDAFALAREASTKKSWGCVLCPIFGPNDAGWLLQAWNRDADLVEAAIIHTSGIECLLACPRWAKEDPFVRILIRKLSGTNPPPSPVDWEKCDGLVPVIAQDAVTKDILMQAYMDEVAWEETLRTGRAVYFSRSRRELWRKGEESGNVQFVREIWVDCDGDCVTLHVEQIGGAACHDGYRSCFYRRIEGDGSVSVIGDRVFDPKQVYKK